MNSVDSIPRIDSGRSVTKPIFELKADGRGHGPMCPCSPLAYVSTWTQEGRDPFVDIEPAEPMNRSRK